MFSLMFSKSLKKCNQLIIEKVLRYFTYLVFHYFTNYSTVKVIVTLIVNYFTFVTQHSIIKGAFQQPRSLHTHMSHIILYLAFRNIKQDIGFTSSKQLAQTYLLTINS